MVAKIPVRHDDPAQLCNRHQIRAAGVFGSVLRDDFRADSDVDVLVEFEPDKDRRLTYFTLADVQHDLANMLQRRVDLSLVDSSFEFRHLSFATPHHRMPITCSSMALAMAARWARLPPPTSAVAQP